MFKCERYSFDSFEVEIMFFFRWIGKAGKEKDCAEVRVWAKTYVTPFLFICQFLQRRSLMFIYFLHDPFLKSLSSPSSSVCEVRWLVFFTSWKEHNVWKTFQTVDIVELRVFRCINFRYIDWAFHFGCKFNPVLWHLDAMATPRSIKIYHPCVLRLYD